MLGDPETFDKVPISLQFVCRRCEDEKFVGILGYLHEVLQFPFEPLPRVSSLHILHIVWGIRKTYRFDL